MASLNKVILIGNVGKDPDVRHTQTGTTVTSFSIATNEKWKGKDGKPEERVEWHKIVAWGRLGEICGEYLSKGSPVYIEGKLQTRKWQDKDGQEKWSTEIIAQEVKFLSARGDSKPAKQEAQSEYVYDSDDIPF